VTVHKRAGHAIDFYNVQFYNQGDTRYDSYNELFISASGFFSGTSVKEIIARGIPANKIVVGKPVNQGDASNTGTVSMTDLGQWTSRAFT
jgi:chitinase